jgi:hypothetical protein
VDKTTRQRCAAVGPAVLRERPLDLDGARHHLEQSLVLAEALGDPAARIAALNNLALAYANGGELEQALKSAEAALASRCCLSSRM